LSEKMELYKDYFLIFLLVGLFIILTVFIIYPVLSLIQYGLARQGIAGFIEVITNEKFVRVILNTFFVSSAVTLISTGMGFVMAYLTDYLKIPGSRIIKSIFKLPLMVPTIVFALGFILVFGRMGTITRLLGGKWDIYGWQGIVIADSLVYLPLAHMLLSSVLSNIDRSLEYAANSLGADDSQAFRTVILPLAAPGIANSALLIFTKSLSDFGIPLILGGNFHVLSVEIYIQGMGLYRIDIASFLALMLLIPSFALLFFQMFWLSKKTYITVTGNPTQVEPRPVRGAVKWLSYMLLAIIGFLICSVYGSLFIDAFNKIPGLGFSFTLDNFKYMILQALDALKNSLLVSALAVPICTITGITIAYLIARRRFIGDNVLNALSMAPLAMPGVVIGIAYLLAFSKPPLLLTGTYLILVLCIAFRELPYTVRTGLAALAQIDPSLEQSAVILSPSSTSFRKVVLPLLGKAAMAGATYTFLRSMTTLSAIIFLVSAGWRLFTIYILDEIELANIGSACALSVTLILIVFMTMFIVNILSKLLGLKEVGFQL